MKFTREQALLAQEATAAAVTAFATSLDVDEGAARTSLFGALLASFIQTNGARSRTELDALVEYIEERMSAALELERGAESVEVAP